MELLLLHPSLKDSPIFFMGQSFRGGGSNTFLHYNIVKVKFFSPVRCPPLRTSYDRVYFINETIRDLNTLIMYVGIACAAVLIRISCPSRDNNFSFHPCNFFHIRSFKHVKIDFFDLPIIVGNLKYFLCLSTSRTPSVSIISLLLSVFTLLLKATYVMLRLTF